MFMSGIMLVARGGTLRCSIALAGENNQTLWPVSFPQVPFSRLFREFVNAWDKQTIVRVDGGFKTHKTIGIVDLFEFDPQHARCGVGIYIHESFRVESTGMHKTGKKIIVSEPFTEANLRACK